MSFDGVNVSQVNGQLSSSAPPEDNVACLIYAIEAGDLPSGMSFNAAYPLIEPKDAEALGIDESNDANTQTRIYGAIVDFFAYAPEGKLYVILVDVSTATPQAILALSGVKASLRDAPKIKGIGIAGLPLTAVELADDHVELVQAQLDAWKTEHRLFDYCILQGNNGTALAETDWAVGDLPDLRALNAPLVSISIAQDPKIADTDPAYALQADIGSVLGMICVRKVNENPGSVDILQKPRDYRGEENYTLTRANRWDGANLANGVSVKSLSSVQKNALSTKGYIYAGSFEGYPGTYLNGGGNCVVITSDYNSIENNRTWNKVARIIRNALIPKVRGVVKKDPVTGFIKSTTITAWTELVNKKVGIMQTSDEISGFGCYINPEQTPDENTPLVVKAKAVKDGIVHEFDVQVGLANQL